MCCRELPLVVIQHRLARRVCGSTLPYPLLPYPLLQCLWHLWLPAVCAQNYFSFFFPLPSVICSVRWGAAYGLRCTVSGPQGWERTVVHCEWALGGGVHRGALLMDLAGKVAPLRCAPLTRYREWARAPNPGLGRAPPRPSCALHGSLGGASARDQQQLKQTEAYRWHTPTVSPGQLKVSLSQRPTAQANCCWGLGLSCYPQRGSCH